MYKYRKTEGIMSVPCDAFNFGGERPGAIRRRRTAVRDASETVARACQ